MIRNMVAGVGFLALTMRSKHARGSMIRNMVAGVGVIGAGVIMNTFKEVSPDLVLSYFVGKVEIKLIGDNDHGLC
jgi:uncharacterized membrane protein YeaQ/YmgE (transglycosylase-associated protein family)